ncbi:MAG: dehydratase [Actinobacteria bacterium]|jgi:acyl dehydratase|nr:dehydratase [Actinomycetota bacterium]
MSRISYSSLAVGTALPERSFQITRADLKRYADASGDQNPIHQDEAFAKSVGLPNLIAHGMYTMALAGKFITDWVGDITALVEFGVRFTKPVIVPADVPATVIFTGSVTELLPGHRAKVEILAISDGVKVLGQARAVVVCDE